VNVTAVSGGTVTVIYTGYTTASGGGSGTVTHTSGALTANQFILGNGAADIKASGYTVVPPASGGASNTTVSGQGYVLWPNQLDFLVNSAGATASGGSGGTVRCALMMLDRAITITKMTVNVTTASSTNKIYLGIYNAAGTTLLVQGTITMTASPGAYTATVSSTTLTPGAYWWAFSTDNATIVMTGNSAINATPLAIMNQNTVIWGFATNSLSGTTLPASLGAITSNNAILPLVKLEP
jgi:hypothetical protein